MRNLLEETIEALANYEKTKNQSFSFVAFEKLAKKINYDAGYGGEQIATDLVVVGEGFWLERAEYDGSEWWEFKTFPKKAKKTEPTREMLLAYWSGQDDI